MKEETNEEEKIQKIQREFFNCKIIYIFINIIIYIIIIKIIILLDTNYLVVEYKPWG